MLSLCVPGALISSKDCQHSRGGAMTHPPTARQQFDAIIESVQREALAAALALGFECTSRQKLLPALKRELAFWKEEYCWELDGPVADFADYPKAWRRVVCISNAARRDSRYHRRRWPGLGSRVL